MTTHNGGTKASAAPVSRPICPASLAITAYVIPIPSPARSMISAEPAMATVRCDAAQRARETAVASSTSARPLVSSLRRRSTDDTANPPVMRAIISSDVLKYESVRLPPAWAMMSSTAWLSPMRSPTSWPTEP